MNYSIYQNVCDVTSNLSSKTPFKIIAFLQIATAPLGVFLNLAMFRLVYKRTVYRLNFKILLTHLHIMIIWYCSGLAFKSIRVIKHLYSEPCLLITEQFSCKGIEIFIYIFPLYNTMYALIIIEIEQLYSAWKYQNEDQGRRSIVLPVTLIVMSWLIALIPQVTPYFSMAYDELMPLCMNLLTLSRSGLVFLITTGMTMEIAALVLSLVNHLCCSITDEVQRYSLSHIKQMCKVILPTTYLHCSIWIPFLSSLLYLGLDSNTIYENRIMLLNATYLFGMIFANVYPIILLKKNANVPTARENLATRRSDICTSSATEEIHSDAQNLQLVPVTHQCGPEAARAHFDYLESLWAKPGQ